jgi:hypothetical protein
MCGSSCTGRGSVKATGYLGSVQVDEQVVTVTKFMRGTTAIPLASINSVILGRRGIGMGEIRFGVSGSFGILAPPLGSFRTSVNDPNVLTFLPWQRKGFAAVKHHVLAAKAHPESR